MFPVSDFNQMAAAACIYLDGESMIKIFQNFVKNNCHNRLHSTKKFFNYFVSDNYKRKQLKFCRSKILLFNIVTCQNYYGSMPLLVYWMSAAMHSLMD